MMISNGKDRHFLLDKSIPDNKKQKTKEQKDKRKASKGSSNKPKHNENAGFRLPHPGAQKPASVLCVSQPVDMRRIADKTCY